MSQLAISVIIVTHNHEQYIDRCLKSLIPEVTKLEGEILLIDNKSSDRSALIVSTYPEVKLFINSQRRGFSANNNFGMALAKGRYILLLNPDTEIVPGALNILIEFMNKRADVGLCGAQLLFPNGQIQPSPRRFPSLGSALARRTPLRIFLRNSSFNRHHLMLDVDRSQPFSVDWLLGACLFIRREILDNVGPLDEGFFLYVEDIDWAFRIHKKGWEVYYVPTAQIIHHHLAVSDKHFFSYRMWLHFRSMIRYVRKYFIGPIPWLSIQKDQTSIWQSTKAQQQNLS
jgi:hypothetical protein